MKKLMVVLAGMVALGFSASADEWRFCGTTKSAGGTSQNNLTGATWSNDGGTTKAAPQVGEDYVVVDGYYCGFVADADVGGTFPGQSLTLGNGTTAGYLDIRRNSNWAYTFPNLIVKKGGIYTAATSGTITLNGGITIEAPDAEFRSNGGYNGSIALGAALHGEPGAQLAIRKVGNSGNDYFRCYLNGDLSDYRGTLVVGGNDSYRSPVFFKDSRLNGTLKVRKSGVIYANGPANGRGEFTVSNLVFEAGGKYDVSLSATTGSTIRVLGEVTLPTEGTARIRLTAMPSSNLSGVRRYPLIIAPAGKGLVTSGFSIYASNAEETCRREVCSLEVTSDEAGHDILYLVVDKYTSLKTKDESGKSSWTLGYSSHWNDVANNTPLDPTVSYLDWSLQMVPSDGYGVVFGGKRLVLGASVVVWCPNGSWRVDDLVAFPGATFLFQDKSKIDWYGVMNLPGAEGGNPVNFYSCGGWSSGIHFEFRGTGNLSFWGDDGRGTIGAGTVVLTATNTLYAGKMTVTAETNNSQTNMTLSIADARSLGGPRAAFAYDAFKINNWSRLVVNGTTAFAEPTRGFFVSGNGIVEVAANQEFALSTQTTLAGRLIKRGAGTLALGGTLKFTSKQAAAPLEGTNVLSVAVGRIRPASKDGANGLAITFAKGTGLRFAPLSETDADVTKYGLYDVAWATPFNLAATDGKLDVAVDVPADAKESFSFGVCTVAEAAADDLEGNIVLPKIKGFKATVVREPAVEGAVTFRADYEKRGLLLLFR